MDDLLPQFDRAKIKTPAGFFRTLFRLHDIGREGVLPAIVKSYSPETGIATVQPLVDVVRENADNEEVLSRRPEYSVRVVRFMHGNCIVDSPLFSGDTGWLIAADRNCKDAIDANSRMLDGDQDWNDPKNKGPMRPSDNSLASFAWGLFIPDSWAKNDAPSTTGYRISDRLKRFGLLVTSGLARLFGAGGSVEIGAEGVDVKGDARFNDSAFFNGKTFFGGKELSVKTMSFSDGRKPVLFLASDDVNVGGGGGADVSVDGVSIDVVDEESNTIQIVGFDGSTSYQVPYKGSDGKIAWGGKAIASISLTNSNKTLVVTYADGTSISFSQPTIPTVGNGVLTITVGGTPYTFTANQTTNTSITIPSGGGDVKVTGTDDVYQTGSDFKIASESNSNVTAKVTKSGSIVTITLGVYYV